MSIDPKQIAKLIDEGWDELGISDPGFEEGPNDEFQPTEFPNWLIHFGSKNFNSKEEAIEYAKHCFGIDLSNDRVNEFKIGDCVMSAWLELNLE